MIPKKECEAITTSIEVTYELNLWCNNDNNHSITFVLLIQPYHPSHYLLTVLPRLTVLPVFRPPVFLAPIGTPEPPVAPFLAPIGTPDPPVFGAVDGLLVEEGNLFTPLDAGSLLTPLEAGSLLTDPIAGFVAAAADLVAVPTAGFFAAGAGRALGCDFGGALYMGRLKACCPPVLVSPKPRGLPAVPILGPTAPV